MQLCTHVITRHNTLPRSPSPSTNVYVSNIFSILTKWSPSSSQSQTRQWQCSVVIIAQASLILPYYSLTTVQDLERSLILILLLAAGRKRTFVFVLLYQNVSRSPRSHSTPCSCWAPGLCFLSPLSRCPRPHHWTGRGRTCTGPPRRVRGRAARPPPRITNTRTLSPMQCNLI